MEYSISCIVPWRHLSVHQMGHWRIRLSGKEAEILEWLCWLQLLCRFDTQRNLQTYIYCKLIIKIDWQKVGLVPIYGFPKIHYWLILHSQHNICYYHETLTSWTRHLESYLAILDKCCCRLVDWLLGLSFQADRKAYRCLVCSASPLRVDIRYKVMVEDKDHLWPLFLEVVVHKQQLRPDLHGPQIL